MDTAKKNVAVFGSAAVAPGTDFYREAEEVGRIIGRLGFDLICGGYGGIMEAVSRGCGEMGGRCRGIGLTRFSPDPNRHIHEFERAKSLGERLDYFDRQADIFLGLPGGIGTITEIMFFWDQAKGGALEGKPILLYGKHWDNFLKVLSEDFLIPEEAFSLVTPVKTLKELPAALKKIFNNT